MILLESAALRLCGGCCESVNQWLRADSNSNELPYNLARSVREYKFGRERFDTRGTRYSGCSLAHVRSLDQGHLGAFRDMTRGPPYEDIRAFFNHAADSQRHGWDGSLVPEDLIRVAKEMGFTDLCHEEVRRIFDDLPVCSDGHVNLKQFEEACSSVPAQVTLRQMVTKFRQLRNFDFSVPAFYDFEASTNENYRNDVPFIGDFKRFRESRDYTYHVTYSEARQEWQDAAIRQVIMRTQPQPTPWLVFTCGPMGVGKGHTLSWMSKQGFFPLEGIVHVDPDAFKAMMPEWPHYVQLNKETAGTLCHHESCFMMEIAQAAAMSERQNIWIDGSLRNSDFYAAQFRDLREAHPHYQIAIFYVDAPESIIRARISARALQTGRDVPQRLIVESLKAMDQSLNKLTPLVDFVARIDNSGTEPFLRAFEVVNTSGSWNLVKERFGQKLVQKEFPHSLPSMPMAVLPVEYCQGWDLTDSAKLRLTSGWLMKRSLTKNLLCLLDSEQPYLDLVVSPMSRITLDENGMARKRAHIPSDAATFCWIYPHPLTMAGKVLHQTALVRKSILTSSEMVHPFMLLLRNGGFCYCNSQGKVCTVTAVSCRAEAALLQFGDAVSVSAVLGHFPVGRLQKVLRQGMRKTGARTFAWVPPDETFGGVSLGGQYGCFLYVMKGETAITFPVLGS